MAGVWIADDDAATRTLYRDCLDLEEFSARVMDGAALRLALEEEWPEGLLVDASLLSSLGGQEALLDRTPRVVLCTARQIEELMPEVVGRRNVRVLSKPFLLRQLEAACRWLSGGPEEPGWAVTASSPARWV